jgi:hypothetical protein
MKRITVGFMLSTLILAIAVWPAHRAAADDETDQVEIKVQATLDATDCLATPPTVTVLGLTIDIGTASLNSNADCEGCGDVTCADLTVGQVAEVKLASDAPDPTSGHLSATEVDMGGGDCNDNACDAVKILGPLQAINATSVTVLGLVVDISQASLQGADDGDNEGKNQLVDVSQLMLGQIVEMTLSFNQAPLAATMLEVKNFTNQIDVEVDDQNGHVDDGAVDDVQVDVEETVVVTPSPAAGVGGATLGSKHVKKVLKFHTASNGHFTLSGLPTGRAKIVVTRVQNGNKSGGKRGVSVKGNTKRALRLRPVR